MRDIKFRGMRKRHDHNDNPKWIIGMLLSNDSIGEVGGKLDHYKYTEVRPHTVGQYIGLQDRTGKEIYEGDGIEIKHPFKERYFKGIIEYVDYKFMVKGFCFTHFDNPTDIFSEGTEYIEVVSNIHENPELL